MGFQRERERSLTTIRRKFVFFHEKFSSKSVYLSALTERR